MTIEQLRILRLAAGTGLSLWVSQAVSWELSFVAPAVTCFLLALPIPGLNFKAGIGFCVVLTLSVHVSLLLLPSLVAYPLVGVLLLALALYWTFYFTASGGNAVLGTLATAGIAISTAVGSISPELALRLANAFSLNAFLGVAFVWIAQGLLPNSLANDFPPATTPEPPPAPKTDPVEARWSALRSLLIVLPIGLWFMLSSASAAYIPVMIKVAAMGQQTTNEDAQKAGHSLIMSTVIGGIAAIIGWQALSIAPTLWLYTLFVALAGLIMGRHIFRGLGPAPDAGTWSYAYLTLIVILGPSVGDTVISNAAGVTFWNRLLMFVLATAYAYAAVYIVQAIRPGRATPTRAVSD